MEATGAIKSLHLVWQICYCSCWYSCVKTGYPSSCRCSHFCHTFMNLLVRIARHMVIPHGKFGGDTIQNGSGRSNLIPSPGMANLLLLLLRFLWKDRLPFIMPLLVFLSQVYEIAGAHCPWHGISHGKFGGNTIQNGSGISNQIPSPDMVNLLLLLLRFLRKDRLPFIMLLLVFLSQVHKITGAHCPWQADYAW